MTSEIGPEQAKINAHFAAVDADLKALKSSREACGSGTKRCDRCGAPTALNALCDDCGALQHQPGCDNLGWGHAAYCRCNNPEQRSNDAPVTTPLPERLRAAADAIAELNAIHGYGGTATENAAVSPKYLREEADKMEMAG